MRSVVASMAERLDKENCAPAPRPGKRFAGVGEHAGGGGGMGMFGSLLEEAGKEVQVEDDGAAARVLNEKYTREKKTHERRIAREHAENDSFARRMARQERLDVQEEDEELALVAEELAEKKRARAKEDRRKDALRLDLVAGARHADRMGIEEDAKLAEWVLERERIARQDSDAARTLAEAAAKREAELEREEEEDAALAKQLQRKLEGLDEKYDEGVARDARFAAELEREEGVAEGKEDDGERKLKKRGRGFFARVRG
eukprot:g7482.t1